MKRLPVALAGALLALLLGSAGVSAQQEGRVYRIGWLWLAAREVPPMPMEKWSGAWAPFRETLRERGYILGKNLVVEIVSADGDIAELPARARQLVASKVDVIVAPGTPAALAAMQATKTIPIVVPGVGFPVEKGIVASLSKPGGNVTGMAVNVESPKLWQLLRELAPSMRLMGTLSNSRNWEGMGPDAAKAYLDKRDAEFRAISSELKVDWLPLRLSSADEIEPGFAEFARRGGTGLIINTDATLWSWRSAIMAAAMRNRLVTACTQEFAWADEGCVLTYGEDAAALRRGAALQVDRILRGARPADIPVELPTKFKLIVNLKSAKALGLAVPPSILAFADEVID